MSERFNKFNSPRTEAINARGFDISGPEDTLENQEMFDKPVVDVHEKIAEGISFEQEHTVLDVEGTHTNRYRVIFQYDNQDIRCGIETKKHPFHLHRLLLNDPDILCAINGGFFLLLDERLETSPSEVIFGTVIRDGVIQSIQSHDRPVLWMDKDSRLNVTEVQSCGQVSIGDASYFWAGVNCNSVSESEPEVLLFSTDSCVVEHEHDERTGTKRILNRERSTTPTREGAIDLVCKIEENRLVVVNKTGGGGTFIITGDVVLQGDKTKFGQVKVGESIGLQYNNFDTTPVRQAITIGPSIFDFKHQIDHSINHDNSLGGKPPFTDRRMARTVIHKTKEGTLTFELFDGAPKTQLFQGVSPHEVYKILTDESDNIEWGYFLDPGQSARLAVRHHDGSVGGYGNQHYVRWPKSPKQPLVWAGEHGRATPSAITLKRAPK